MFLHLVRLIYLLEAHPRLEQTLSYALNPHSKCLLCHIQTEFMSGFNTRFPGTMLTKPLIVVRER